MAKLPLINAKELAKILDKLDFQFILSKRLLDLFGYAINS
jgi:hypothetical protein